jgi:hypothetical protein
VKLVRISVALLGFACIGLLLAGSEPIAAAELKPSWTCLPEETVALVRIPGGNAAAEALKTRTKLGALLFNPDRIGRLGELLGDKGREEWEEFTQGMAKYDLKISDLSLLLQGEAGFAVALEAREGKLPRPLGIAWLEPGGDLTTRLLAALDKSLQEDSDGKMHRTDIELAGQKVIHLSQTITRTRPAGANELRKLSPDERKALREGRGETDTIVAGGEHILLARLEGRLLVAMNFGPMDDEMQELPAGANAADESSDPAIESLKKLMSRFLAAHSEGGTGATLSLLEVPGLAAALPAGVPVVEVLADLRPLVKLADTATDPRLPRILKGLGFDQLGPLAYRLSLEDSLLRTGFFLSAPEPRTGIVALVDQPPLTAQPPAWVPADVVSYAHARFDIAEAFEQIKKPLLEEMGDQVQPILSLMELQLKNMIQTDLKSLLSSLGTQYVMLAYPPREIDETDLEKVKAASDRSAFILPTKDEALWKRVLETVAGASNKEVIEEQGFKGVRFAENGEGGVFVGHGYLVVGIGADVSENVLSALRNPPAGPASLAASALFARANELLPPTDGLAYYLTDMNRYAKTTRRTLSNLLNLTLKTHDGDDADDADLTRTLRTLQTLMPSEDELEGIFGVEVGQTIAGPHGLTNRGVVELPGPGR